MTKGGMFKTCLGLIGAVMMTASLSFASLWGSHKSSVKSAHVTIASAMTLANGKVLEAGSYRVEVPQNSEAPEVTFYRDGKPVATAQAKVVAENQKNPYTEVDSTKERGNDVIMAIRPGGWKQELLFSETNGQTSSGGQ